MVQIHCTHLGRGIFLQCYPCSVASHSSIQNVACHRGTISRCTTGHCPHLTFVTLQNARELLKATEAEEAAARIELQKLSSRQTHTHLYQFNASIVTPSPHVAKAIVAAAASIASLDTVSADARALTASLTNLSATAESAVRKIRELDGVRTRIQLALDRVEDVIDLQSCLSGVSAATELGDLESAALHIKRFRSLEGHLPVPESDVAFMRHAEAVLLEAVTKQFDDAIAENQAYQISRTQIKADHTPQPDDETAQRLTQIEASISHCCQLMNVLGHSEMGLTRYAAYLNQNYDAECKGKLLELCSMGIDTPAAAINTVSAVFASAAELLQQISTPATAALFGAGSGPRQLLAAVHAVCDRHSARVLRSMARSGRFQAALIAREKLLRGDEPKSPITKEPAEEITAAEAYRVAQQLENPSNDVPFVLPAPGSITSSVYRGIDYFDSSTYEMFLDELALTLQRCSSYLRLLLLRASDVDSYRPADAGEATHHRSDSMLKDLHRIRDSMAELGGCYSVLEQSKIQAAVVKAINLDEVVDDGAAGASVDILSGRALELVEAPSSALAKWAEVMHSDGPAAPELQVGPPGTGEGALITTMVEDGFYVCSRAMKRAFATGNPECVSGIINNIVMVIGDRLSAELTIRLRVALEDPSAGVPIADIPSVRSHKPAATRARSYSRSCFLYVQFGVNVSQAQRDRLHHMRSRMMNSPPIKSAAARLVELQSPSSPLLRSPQSSSPALKLKAPPGTESSVPSARLTEEVASTCIALNNVQLAIACAARMRSELELQVHDVFAEARYVVQVDFRGSA
jgi:hypothetical protein